MWQSPKNIRTISGALRMAFVGVIQEDIFQADTFREGRSWAIIVNIGYDDERPLSYSIVVGLSPMAGGPIEFYFHMVEADGETGEEHIYWCGRDVAHFIPPESRSIILATVMTATKALIENACPQRVEMVSYDEDPPAKALVKHFLIGRVFEQCGYTVRTADEFHGKRVWWMERNSKVGVATE
jgi:hypothetical protein